MLYYYGPLGVCCLKAALIRVLRRKCEKRYSPYHTNFSQNKLLIGFLKTNVSRGYATKSKYVANISKSKHCTQTLNEVVIKKKYQNNLIRRVGILLKLIPLSLCIFGVIEWQLNKRNCIKKDLIHTASQLETAAYCSLPLRLLSRCWGWLAGCRVPENFRPYIYGLYSNTFKVNLEEALYDDFMHYNSLLEFFTRPLREGVRPIDKVAPLISPADGKILHFGTATQSLIEQVKGVNYNISDLFGPITWTNIQLQKDAEYFKQLKHYKDDSTMLFQCVIYLAPGDYHRFHSPTNWEPLFRRHFTGELLSVSPRIAKWLPGLFCLNERAIYVGKWKYGFFSYTAVGATNVGSLQIYIDEELKTNQCKILKKDNRQFYDLNLQKDLVLNKGDLFGQFNMGSTIVLIFEAPINFQFKLTVDQKIRMGEPLGYIQ